MVRVVAKSRVFKCNILLTERKALIYLKCLAEFFKKRKYDEKDKLIVQITNEDQ